MDDLRAALRHFRKSPGFVFTVVVTIALGIGANTAIFTLVHAILLRSLPVGNPKALYRIGDRDDCCIDGGFINEDGDFDLFSYDLYKSFRDSSPEFDQLAAMQAGADEMSVRRGSERAQSERTEMVSGNYFTALGVRSFIGRTFTQSDDRDGAAPVAVMSYATWQSKYAGDPGVVGSTFYIQGIPVTIAGVAPPGFFGDRVRSDPPEIWLPLSLEPVINKENTILHVAPSNWLYVIGRLKPGVDTHVLEQKLSARLRQWLATQEAYTRQGGSTLIPKQYVKVVAGGGGIQNLQQETSKGLYLLMAISGLVLLIACANVANLLLARGMTRRADTSIRMALGASRAHLVRQMLTESVVLACAGGLLGLAIAYAGAKTILSLAFPHSPELPVDATPSFAVLAFAFLLSLLTGVIFGIVPAWVTSHSDPAETLRGMSRSVRDRASLPQNSLIVFQAALSVVLLMGAGLLTRSLRNLEHQDFGVQTENRYVVHLFPAGAGYTADKLPTLYRALEQQFGALPGVESVGLGLYSPLEGNNWGEGVYVEGRPEPSPNENNNSSWDRVSPGFFAAVGQKIIRGRGISQEDTASSQKIAVVNEAFVHKYFPKEDPMGKHFGVYRQKYAGSFEIVGVVANAKYDFLRDPVRPMYFLPLTQRIENVTEPGAALAQNRSMYINSIILRFQKTPGNVDELIRHTLADIDPNLTVTELRSMDAQAADNFTQERLVSRLATLFGLLALVLAAIGLYGITSYQVARRTSEIGLRMALGADRANVVNMVLRAAFRQVGIGLAIGIPVALIGAHFMADQLYVVKAYDPVSLIAAIVTLILAAAVAGYIPARRAACIEPMTALRIE